MEELYNDNFYDEDFVMNNPNLFYERPQATSGLWFYYIYPWQENTPWLFTTGSGDSEE